MTASRKNLSNKYPKQRRAIDTAKLTFPRVSSEPIVPYDVVLLREIVHALDLLTGSYNPAVCSNYDHSILQSVLSALSNGSLVTRTFTEDAIIPAASWPKELMKKIKKDTDFNSTFWAGEIIADNQCQGLVGSLPMATRKDAEKWLSTAVKGKLGRPSKQEAARSAYDYHYPNGHKTTGDSWKDVQRKIIETTGEYISINTIKSALKD